LKMTYSSQSTDAKVLSEAAPRTLEEIELFMMQGKNQRRNQ